MKLKEYNAENTREGAAGKKLSNGVTLSVYRTGVITFSSGLAALAGIPRVTGKGCAGELTPSMQLDTHRP